MQKPPIKLREIIWEITGECHNNCSYCGSKDVSKKTLNHREIADIARSIADFPPQEINISGGDPLILPIELHTEILKILRLSNIVCKIIVNPRSIASTLSAAIDIIEMYDWVGVSINNQKELQIFENIVEQKVIENYTVITNFNGQNLYQFDEIEAFVKKYDKMWTIQFTVYQDDNNLLALYHPDNEIAFEQLQNKVKGSSAKIILSDNIRDDMPCGAGFTSVGITYNGFVIPCLSMRSWRDIELLCTAGFYKNLFTTPFEEIWRTSFIEERFYEFMCCKDACLNKTLKVKSFEKKIFEKPLVVETKVEEGEEEKDVAKFFKEAMRRPEIPFNPGAVVMYAVVSPHRDYPPDDNGGGIVMYGVFGGTNNGNF